MAAKTTAKKSGFTAEEKAAMKERAAELKANRSKAEGEADVLAKIADMPEPDRGMAERLHALVKAEAPDLVPRTWYGMPAYSKGDKVLLFFKPASKFKSRYSTLGFSDTATLDDGGMWPTDFALTQLTKAEERRISELLKRALG
jgi:uncharacterized protein YdhG (YjbR/CyaY superfamily)